MSHRPGRKVKNELPDRSAGKDETLETAVAEIIKRAKGFSAPRDLQSIQLGEGRRPQESGFSQVSLPGQRLENQSDRKISSIFFYSHFFAIHRI